jgi:hypothetical protein
MRLDADTAATQTARPPSIAIGAASGAVATLGFLAIHDVWILDIWDMTGPMVFAGAICGAVIAWSYRAAVGDHTWPRWLGYNGLITTLLVLLGVASLLLLDPRYTMAEAMVLDDPLAELLPPATPLMVAAGLVGALILWGTFGRRPEAIVPIVTAQALLVFLIGHNLAVLGLVEMSGALATILAEFAALTTYLAAAYAAGVFAAERVRATVTRSRAASGPTRP